jgi:hypothetical protein
MDTWKIWFKRPKPHMDALKELYTMASTDVPVEQRQMAKGENHLRPHLIHFNRSKNVTAANNWLLKHGLNRRDYRISTDVIDKHIYLYNTYTTQIKDAHRNQMSSHLAKKGYGIWAK